MRTRKSRYADVDALFAEADDDVRAIRWGCYARIVVVSAMFEFCSQNKTGPPAAEWGRLISDAVNTPVLDGLDELAIDPEPTLLLFFCGGLTSFPLPMPLLLTRPAQ